MKKMLAVNIILLLCMAALAEFWAWSTLDDWIKNQGFWKIYAFRKAHFDEVPREFRPVEVSYKKRPLVIFGCSYAYGWDLEDNQEFGYKLSHLTKRPVYNRAFNGWGIQHMLYQLKNYRELDEIKNPEYVIFVFINDHLRRLRTDRHQLYDAFGNGCHSPNIRYIERNGKLELKKNPLSSLYRSFFVTKMMYNIGFNRYLEAEKNPKEREKLSRLVKLHFMESKQLINQKWPGAKIVILQYYNTYPGEHCYAGMDFWKDLEKEGFIILDANEITGVDLSKEFDYRLGEDEHPNEQAWDVIVPALVRKLNIN